MYFNNKHRRKDHLFQGRFKAILVDANEDITLLARYIHLNPVHAKIVTHTMEYPWSSYPAFAGKRRTPDWLETDTVVSYFGRGKKEAIVNH